MIHAWNFIYVCISGVIDIFERLFDYFNLSQILLPLLFITCVYSFILSPIIGHYEVKGEISKKWENNKKSNSTSKND